MDPKITILFMLIGAIIGLSYLNEGNLRRVRQQLVSGAWRQLMPSRRRI